MVRASAALAYLLLEAAASCLGGCGCSGLGAAAARIVLSEIERQEEVERQEDEHKEAGVYNQSKLEQEVGRREAGSERQKHEGEHQEAGQAESQEAARADGSLAAGQATARRVSEAMGFVNSGAELGSKLVAALESTGMVAGGSKDEPALDARVARVASFAALGDVTPTGRLADAFGSIDTDADSGSAVSGSVVASGAAAARARGGAEGAPGETATPGEGLHALLEYRSKSGTEVAGERAPAKLRIDVVLLIAGVGFPTLILSFVCLYWHFTSESQQEATPVYSPAIHIVEKLAMSRQLATRRREDSGRVVKHATSSVQCENTEAMSSCASMTHTSTRSAAAMRAQKHFSSNKFAAYLNRFSRERLDEVAALAIKLQGEFQKYPKSANGRKNYFSRPQSRYFAVMPLIDDGEEIDEVDEYPPMDLDHWQRGDLLYWENKQCFDSGFAPKGCIHLMDIREVVVSRSTLTTPDVIITFLDKLELAQLVMRFPTREIAWAWKDNLCDVLMRCELFATTS